VSLQIIVPMPSFDSQTKKPWAKTPKEKEKVSMYSCLWSGLNSYWTAWYGFKN